MNNWAKAIVTKRLWQDHTLLYKYFHGDNGAGIGTSHRTGRTSLVAVRLLQGGNKG